MKNATRRAAAKRLVVEVQVSGGRVHFDLAAHRRGEAVLVGQSRPCGCGADLAASATARPGLWHQKPAIVCACGREYAVQSTQVEVAT